MFPRDITELTIFLLRFTALVARFSEVNSRPRRTTRLDHIQTASYVFNMLPDGSVLVGGSTRNDTDRPKSEPWRGLLVVAKFSLGADDPTKEDFSLRYAPITSLVYATFTIIYLAFEGAIIVRVPETQPAAVNCRFSAAEGWA